MYIFRPTSKPAPLLKRKATNLVKLVCLHISGATPANDNSASGFKPVVYYQIYMYTNILADTYIRSSEDSHRL